VWCACCCERWLQREEQFHRPILEGMVAAVGGDAAFGQLGLTGVGFGLFVGVDHVVEQQGDLQVANGICGDHLKYSLQLIMARLPKGAETSISMAFLVMCAEKILRMLCLFFVAFCVWVCCCLRLRPLMVAHRNICQFETAEFLIAA
jgi:hypothetical protein